MKKKLLLAISLMGTLALTGCKVQNVKVKGGCRGGSSSPTHCTVTTTGTFKKDAVDGGFDASLMSIDLSSSSVNLTSTSGSMVIIVKNTSGITVATSIFNWYSSGNILYPTNPSQLTNWVNANVVNGYEITYDIDNIETTGELGNNTFTAVYRYGTHSVGASSGFYLNNADLNGF